MAEQHSAIEMLGDITVDTDNSHDIGATSKRIKDLYLAGNVTDDTTTTAITDILNAKRYALLVS